MVIDLKVFIRNFNYENRIYLYFLICEYKIYFIKILRKINIIIII